LFDTLLYSNQISSNEVFIIILFSSLID